LRAERSEWRSNLIYFDLIQDAVGLDPNASQYRSRGTAALTLYRLTAAMFADLIPDKNGEVVNRTFQLIKEAGTS
jgi:hypothetical protein